MLLDPCPFWGCPSVLMLGGLCLAATGGPGGGSPSSPQPSGTAREADARAAARNTITLPRPRVGLCIWGGAERERRACYPSTSTCISEGPSTLTHHLTPSCGGQQVDHDSHAPVPGAGC